VGTSLADQPDLAVSSFLIFSTVADAPRDSFLRRPDFLIMWRAAEERLAELNRTQGPKKEKDKLKQDMGDGEVSTANDTDFSGVHLSFWNDWLVSEVRSRLC
jgi:hypothetical protein